MKTKPRFYDGPRMSDLAAEAEADWTASRLAEDRAAGRTVLGFQGWTHMPSALLAREALLDELGALVQGGSAVALQVTVTGLGATVAEPGIRPAAEEIGALQEVMSRLGVGWEAVCARIDPLQSFVREDGEEISNLGTAPALIRRLATLGARRFRTSVIQLARYRSKIVPRLERRGLRLEVPEGERLRSAVASMRREAENAGAELRSCAFEMPGLAPGACFDPAWFRTLCRRAERNIDALWRKEKAVAPRRGCLCARPADARMMKIPARGPCPGRCAACYAQR